MEYNSCINDEKGKVIMTMFYKTKAELRAETEEQLKVFFKKGVSIEVIKPLKAPKLKMTAKSTRVTST